jgi:hypothetical protein
MYTHSTFMYILGTAAQTSSREGAFHGFYQGLLTKGMQPAMARLALQ